ncbi:MAG TPA: YhjD/YihY/BrkB family envelope integrity protein [Longimicrobium sp.]|jgi:membrane protein
MEPETRLDPRGGGDERPLGELLRSLGADAAALVRQEIALARAEVGRGARALAGSAGKIAAGAVAGSVGALVLVAALVAGLGELMGGRYWLAALLVGAALLAAGGLLVVGGARSARRASLAPGETLETLRETGDWARGEASGLRAALAAGGARGGGNGGVRRLAPGIRRERADHTPRTAPERDDGSPPLSLPLWKRVWTELKRDDIPGQAAKVAYYFFLSLPPLLMAAFGLAGMFGGDATADWLTRQLRGNLPGEASGLVQGFVDEVVRSEHPGLFSLGLLLALWSGSSVFAALEDALNAAYGITEKRGFAQKRLVTLGTLLAVGVLFTAGSAALLAGPALSRALGLGAAGELAWSVAQWPLAFALVVGAFWVIYYVLPNRDQRRCKGVLLKSAAVAAGLWVLATLAFRLYVGNFGSYSKTYGLLGAVIVLLLWMYYTSLVILLGGEISSEMERTA